jgi:DNA-binding protein HU
MKVDPFLLQEIFQFPASPLFFSKKICIHQENIYICECIKNLLVLILKLSIMNKAQLIDAIAEKAGLTKADSKKALEAFVATIGESLKKDEKVALVGFGSFSVSERSARSGRNPQTGKTIQIPAKKVVRFKAGAELEGQL